MNLTGIILAGGKSSRLGTYKAALIGPRVEVVMRDCFPVVLTIRDDDTPGLGPLGGLATALRRAPTDAIFVVACDMPFLNAALIRELAGQLGEHDAVVPQVGDRFEPLHAAYHRRCLPIVEEQIRTGDYSLQQLILRLRARIVRRADWGQALLNINTPAEWQAARPGLGRQS